MSHEKNEFEEAVKQGLNAGLIKVHFTLDSKAGSPAGETVWATPIGKKYAKINNIPFFADDVSIDDIVEIQPNEENHIKEFVSLVTRGSTKYLMTYQTADNQEETIDRFRQLREYITKKKCKIEGASPGYCVVAVPVDMPPKTAEKILKKAPFVLDFG